MKRTICFFVLWVVFSGMVMAQVTTASNSPAENNAETAIIADSKTDNAGTPDNNTDSKAITDSAGETKSSSVEIDPKTGFPVIKEKPFVVFEEGVTASWVTRIIKQTDRSNFVFEDFFGGAFFSMQTRNMQPVDSMIRLAAYYPLSYKFNKHPQVPVNVLNFAVDLLAAPFLNFSLWNYVRIDVGAGLHFFYQMADRWHYVHLGIGGVARLDMPLAKRWTLFFDGIASYDYGNLGTNGEMEPYDYVWQYQLGFGVRYSKKAENKYSYIPSKR
ncbi:MAG: hypothetical protein MST11_09820 [Spirochaetia bacterium]|nr:hypothetical protein [Spirochaetia bacterium]